MEKRSAFYVIREGLEAGKGGYLSDEDGFVKDFAQAHRVKDLWAVNDILTSSILLEENETKGRAVRVEMTWVEHEQPEGAVRP